MKERSSLEPRPFSEKLVTAVAIDFPEVREILVNLPEQWELIGSVHRGDLPLYAASLPWSMEKPRRDHFHGLSAEINLTLHKYRHAKLFEPWPQPVIPVAWNAQSGEGKTMRGGSLDVRLQSVAEAQVWAGSIFGVVWEAYSFESRRREHWKEDLAVFWQAVEADMQVAKLFTQPFDPEFAEGYTDFLSALGYQPDTDFPLWWSKER